MSEDDWDQFVDEIAEDDRSKPEPSGERTPRRQASWERRGQIVLSTTGSLDRCEIAEYIELASAVVSIGTSTVAEVASGIRDKLGKRSSTMESKVNQARREAVREIIAQAKEVGGNAVIGIRIAYTEIGSHLVVAISGTVVVAEEVFPAGGAE